MGSRQYWQNRQLQPSCSALRFRIERSGPDTPYENDARRCRRRCRHRKRRNLNTSVQVGPTFCRRLREASHRWYQSAAVRRWAQRLSSCQMLPSKYPPTCCSETPNSLSAVNSSSSRSFTLPCQSGDPSMNETPRPLTVFAIITVGLTEIFFASVNAALICWKSWPSISITCQRNASHLARRGSTPMMFSLESSLCSLLWSTTTQRLSSL